MHYIYIISYIYIYVPVGGASYPDHFRRSSAQACRADWRCLGPGPGWRKAEAASKVDILGRNARSTAFSVIIGFDWFCVWDSIVVNLLNFFWFLVGLSCDGIWAYLTTLLQAFVGPARLLWKRPYATQAMNAVQWRLPRVGWKDSYLFPRPKWAQSCPVRWLTCQSTVVMNMRLMRQQSQMMTSPNPIFRMQMSPGWAQYLTSGTRRPHDRRQERSAWAGRQSTRGCEGSWSLMSMEISRCPRRWFKISNQLRTGKPSTRFSRCAAMTRRRFPN